MVTLGNQNNLNREPGGDQSYNLGGLARDLIQLMRNFGNHKGIWVTHVPYGYTFGGHMGVWGNMGVSSLSTCGNLPHISQKVGNMRQPEKKTIQLILLKICTRNTMSQTKNAN